MHRVPAWSRDTHMQKTEGTEPEPTRGGIFAASSCFWCSATRGCVKQCVNSSKLTQRIVKSHSVCMVPRHAGTGHSRKTEGTDREPTCVKLSGCLQTPVTIFPCALSHQRCCWNFVVCACEFSKPGSRSRLLCVTGHLEFEFAGYPFV